MPRIPRPNQGDPIRAEDFGALADAAESNDVSVGSSGGARMHKSSTGTNIWLEPPEPDDAALPFRVTVAITAAAGRTYGSGKGIKQKDDGTNLVDDGTTEEVIKTHNERGIKGTTNAIVFCCYSLGSWWTLAPDKCSNLV